MITTEIIAAAKAGNVASISTLCENTARIARSVARAYLKREEDIEDVGQLCCVKVYMSLQQCQATTVEQFRTYVCKVARNLCYDFYKAPANRRYETYGLNDQSVDVDEQAGIDASEIVYAAACQVGSVVEVELAVSGHSLSEIGRKLGKAKSSVQRRMDAHKAAVRGYMERAAS